MFSTIRRVNFSLSIIFYNFLYFFILNMSSHKLSKNYKKKNFSNIIKDLDIKVKLKDDETTLSHILLENDKIMSEYKKGIMIKMLTPEILKVIGVMKNKVDSYLSGGYKKTHKNLKGGSLLSVLSNTYKTIISKKKDINKQINIKKKITDTNFFTNYSYRDIEDIKIDSINKLELNYINNIMLNVSNFLINNSSIIELTSNFIDKIFSFVGLSGKFNDLYMFLKTYNNLFRISMSNINLLFDINIDDKEYFNRLVYIIKNYIFTDFETESILSLSDEETIKQYFSKNEKGEYCKKFIKLIKTDTLKLLFIDIIKYRSLITINLDKIYQELIYDYFVNNCFINYSKNIKSLQFSDNPLDNIIKEIISIINFNISDAQNLGKNISKNYFTKITNLSTQKNAMLLLLGCYQKLFFIHTNINDQEVILKFINTCLLNEKEKMLKPITYCFDLLTSFIKEKLKHILSVPIKKYNVIQKYSDFLNYSIDKLYNEYQQRQLYKNDVIKHVSLISNTDSMIHECVKQHMTDIDKIEYKYVSTNEDLIKLLPVYIQKEKELRDNITDILNKPLLAYVLKNANDLTKNKISYLSNNNVNVLKKNTLKRN